MPFAFPCICPFSCDRFSFYSRSILSKSEMVCNGGRRKKQLAGRKKGKNDRIDGERNQEKEDGRLNVGREDG